MTAAMATPVSRLAPGVPGLRFHDVHAGYGEIVVLRGVSVAVPPGQVVAVLGPNGAGKTTLLRAAFGLARVHSGRVELDGRGLAGLPSHRIAREGLCYIPEGRAIYRRLTVEENLRLFRRAQPSGPGIERSYQLFPVLRERRAQVAGTLSGGQQQMLALARSVVCDYRMLLVDELSMGLAPLVIGELFEVLGSLKAAGLTIVVVEQYAQRALALADLVYVMNRGTVVFSGEPAELSGSPELVSLYLEGGARREGGRGSGSSAQKTEEGT